MNQPVPPQDEKIIFQGRLYRDPKDDPRVKKPLWRRMAIGGGIGALLLGASTLGFNAYQDRPYTESQCHASGLTAMLWAGGDDAQREQTIHNIEQYLSAPHNSSDRELAETSLRLLRANAADAGIDESTLSDKTKNSSIYRYLNFINDMRGDRFEQALNTITNAIEDRALDCAETGAWDTNNRRATVARWALNNERGEEAYAIASHIFTNDTTTKFNLNMIAGDAQMQNTEMDATRALTHYTAARGVATSDFNIARSEYNLGMANTALNNDAEARTHFANASRFPETLYGQIGAFKIGAPVATTAPPSNANANPNDPPLAFAASVNLCADNLFINQRADVRAVPASLTKMMTLYTFAQVMADSNTNLNLDTMIEVPTIIRDKIPHDLATLDNLTVGRRLPVRMFLTMAGARSDAISTITLAMAAGQARGWQGTPEQINDRFIALMNENARNLGMTKSEFGNVIGNNAARGDAGNISSPHDMVRLINAFQRQYPRAFDIALGQHRIDIKPISDANTPSSRNLRDDRQVIGAKTGFLRDRDPTYNMAAGYNETLIRQFRDINSVRYTGTISLFGADSSDNREDVMKSLIAQYNNLDVRAFCEAGPNFRYHPFNLPVYTTRLAQNVAPR